MNKVDELMVLVNSYAFIRAECRQGLQTFEAMNAANDEARIALTTTIAEYEARIAELEAIDQRIRLEAEMARDEAKGEQAFLDAVAIRIYTAMSTGSLHSSEREAKWAYDAAEALLAERRKRMVRP